MRKALLPLFILFLIFSGCETEKLTPNSATEVEVSHSNIEFSFDEKYSELIPFNFDIDWTSGKEGFSSDLNSEIIEFDVIWTGDITPDVIYQARENNDDFKDSNYKTTYKILAQKVDESYTFYSVKFTSNDELGSTSLFSLDSFNGTYTIVDERLNNLAIMKISNGIHSELTIRDSKLNESLTNRCETRLFEIITTYYNVREGGNLEVNFTRSEFVQMEVCSDGGNTGSGGTVGGEGGSGGSSNSGGGIGHQPDSFEDYEDVIYEDEIIETPPSCKSFNFKITTSNYYEALVLNVHFKIVLVEINSAGLRVKKVHPINFPQAIKFGVPAVLANGTEISPQLAAELSAKAIKMSIREILENYEGLLGNTNVIREEFKEILKNNQRHYTNGGRVNFNDMTSTLTPTQYRTSALWDDNCQ
ncbi:hypothetical protein [Cellulophaga sp. Asnod2-G02]|uniref:hypothetical protein n=1 Tax=Cellulophaga sp. Asnod2-G02 TaxID=3160572 RepID=UPI0038632529